MLLIVLLAGAALLALMTLLHASATSERGVNLLASLAAYRTEHGRAGGVCPNRRRASSKVVLKGVFSKAVTGAIITAFGAQRAPRDECSAACHDRRWAMQKLTSALLVGAASLAGGGAVTTSWQAPADTLIPRDKIFGYLSRASGQISPDGRHVSWLAPVDG
jgi:hypothetical protein